MTPAERLGLVIAGWAVLVGLLWLAGRSISRLTELRQGARLDRSRPAVDEHLADRVMDIPVPARLVPVELCDRCGQVRPADHRALGLCTGAAR